MFLSYDLQIIYKTFIFDREKKITSLIRKLHKRGHFNNKNNQILSTMIAGGHGEPNPNTSWVSNRFEANKA